MCQSQDRLPDHQLVPLNVQGIGVSLLGFWLCGESCKESALTCSKFLFCLHLWVACSDSWQSIFRCGTDGHPSVQNLYVCVVPAVHSLPALGRCVTEQRCCAHLNSRHHKVISFVDSRDSNSNAHGLWLTDNNGVLCPGFDGQLLKCSLVVN